ncbi:MAG TPA: hypothetical protein VEU08_19045 [Vicinamibacterales bacterium]|nr:hypothetical protein [Vicinamibacterales bacterium]
MSRGAVIAAALVTFAAAAVVRTGPADDRGTLVDNASVRVMRYHLAPGATAGVAPIESPALIVQVTAGDVDLTVGSSRASGPREAGAIAYVPARTQARARNIADRAATDIVVVGFKQGRVRPGAMPPVDAPPGIIRTPLLDNADTRVVRVEFSPEGREPLHTHPYDLITLQISPARVEILDGDTKTSEPREPGFTRFVPRNRQHAYASADDKRFEILSIAIK